MIRSRRLYLLWWTHAMITGAGLLSRKLASCKGTCLSLSLSLALPLPSCHGTTEQGGLHQLPAPQSWALQPLEPWANKVLLIALHVARNRLQEKIILCWIPIFISIVHSFCTVDEAKINENKKKNNIKDTGGRSCHFSPNIIILFEIENLKSGYMNKSHVRSLGLPGKSFYVLYLLIFTGNVCAF